MEIVPAIVFILAFLLIIGVWFVASGDISERVSEVDGGSEGSNVLFMGNLILFSGLFILIVLILRMFGS